MSTKGKRSDPAVVLTPKAACPALKLVNVCALLRAMLHARLSTILDVESRDAEWVRSLVDGCVANDNGFAWESLADLYAYKRKAREGR